jgi:hypothetical protein
MDNRNEILANKKLPSTNTGNIPEINKNQIIIFT